MRIQVEDGLGLFGRHRLERVEEVIASEVYVELLGVQCLDLAILLLSRERNASAKTWCLFDGPRLLLAELHAP